MLSKPDRMTCFQPFRTPLVSVLTPYFATVLSTSLIEGAAPTPPFLSVPITHPANALVAEVISNTFWCYHHSLRIIYYELGQNGEGCCSGSF